MEVQIYRFTWRGIEIEARYEPLRWHVVDQLEIESVAPKGAPLPITETGYRSFYPVAGTIKAIGGDVVAQVIAWLDEEAGKPEWKRHVESCRQFSLF